MESLSDAEFFSKLSIFFDDSPAEAFLTQAQIIKRLQDSLMSVEIKLNLPAVSILRMWTRKLSVRLNFESDPRIKLNYHQNPEKSLQTQVKRFCLGFAELCAALFSKPEVLPIASITCKELLIVGGVCPSDIIIASARNKLDEEPTLITLLEIIALSNSTVDGLPTLDPKIAFHYPKLYQKILSISPENQRLIAENVCATFNKINSFKNGNGFIEKNLAKFITDTDSFNLLQPEIILTCSDNIVREKFFERVDNSFDITPYLEIILKASIFDEKIQNQAITLLSKNLLDLSESISPDLLTFLQCAKSHNNSQLFLDTIKIINNFSDFDLIAAWSRYLFHKDNSVRKEANVALSKIINSKVNIDTQIKGDSMAKDFRNSLMHSGSLTSCPNAEKFIDVIFNRSQQKFVRSAAAQQLSQIILNPYNDIKKYLPLLHELSFSEFPRLLHALSIRDSSFVIHDTDRLVELLTSITPENSFDLVPILARSVFSEIIYPESDGSNLCRLPFFVTDNFDVQCSIGTFKPKFYEDMEPVMNEEAVSAWVNYKYQPRRPIRKNIDFGIISTMLINDELLANDLLNQLEDDPYALDVMVCTRQPRLMLYTLMIACQCAKRTTPKVSEACLKMLNDSPEMGLKLAQTVLELDGDIQIPAKLTDYIMDESTRRSALSLLTTFIARRKTTDGVDFTRILSLLDEKQPINIYRQLASIFASQGRSKLGSRFLVSRDGITKCMGFEMAELNEANFKCAVDCAMGDGEAVCARAAAVEFISEYFKEFGYQSLSLSILFYQMQGENPFTYSLLRLLSNSEVRNQVQDFEKIIIPFISETEESNPVFVKAALYTLVGHSIQSEEIYECLTALIDDGRFTNDVLGVMSTMDSEVLGKFTPEVIFRITDALSDDIDIKLALCIVNHCLIAGIEFPDQSTEHLINLYSSYIQNKCSLVHLHVVMTQMFKCSMSSRTIALKMGFLDLAFEEIKHANPELKMKILVACAQFVYGYREGQNALVQKWGVENLIELFSTTPTVVSFFLCLVKQNEDTQSTFLVKFNGKSLLDILQTEINSGSENSAHLLELFANVLNSSKVRNRVFIKKNVIQKYIEVIQIYSDDKHVALLEAWLRVFITISLYSDGLDRLYGSGHVSDLLLHFFRSGDSIRNNKIFLIFLRNLIRDRTHREGLKAKIIQECIRYDEAYLVDVFNSLIESSMRI